MTTRTTETRNHIGELRAASVKGKPGVTLKVITPGVADDYGSVWMADVFDESLRTRLPTLCWAHDWAEPLGPAVAYRLGPRGPEIDFMFSDFNDVPQARRAWSQVKDGTIRDCSVGFLRRKWREASDADRDRWPGAREVITKADLDEVSLVLRGAVPGAAVMSVRRPAGSRAPDPIDDPVVEKWIQRAQAEQLGERLRLADKLRRAGQL